MRKLSLMRLGLLATTALATGCIRPTLPASPFTLTVHLTRNSESLHVELLNDSNVAHRVLLGGGDGSDHDSIDCVELELTSSTRSTYDMVPIGIPISGSMRILQTVIAPHQRWSSDLPLDSFMGDEQGKALTNPKLLTDLPPGTYKLHARLKGENSSWPDADSDYWLGQIGSNTESLILPVKAASLP